MKKIFTTLLLSLLLISCGTKKDDTLRVGMEVGYAPFNWFQNTDENGAVKIKNGYANGYDVQIAKLIAQKLGKKLEIVQSDWDSLLGPALNSNKVDLVIAGVSPLENRKLSMDFTNSYYKSDMVVVVRKDGKYILANKLEDLSGAKLTGQLNTVHYDLIDQIPGVNKQQALDSAPVLVAALQSGRIDGFVTEKPAGLATTLADNSLMLIEFTNENGFKYNHDEIDVAIGVKKGNTELLNEVNKALSEISSQDRENLMLEAIQNQPLSQ